VIYCYIILIYLLTWKIKLSESCVWFQCFSKRFSSFWTNLIPCWMMCQCVLIYKEIYWVIYCYIILIYLLTSKIKLNESCVWFQCFSNRFSSFWINLIVCWTMCQCVCEYIKRYIEWYIVILYWFIYSHPRLSWVRVVFDFNALASDSAPFEPIWFTVERYVSVWIYKEIYWVIYCYIILIYLLTPKIKLSESCVWFQYFSNRFSSFWINLIACWTMCQCVREYIKRYIEWYIVILYWFIYSPERSSWIRVVFDFNASASDSAPFEPIRFPVKWCVSVCEYIKRYMEWYIVILYW
jgi:hypothetical protein